MNTKTYLAMQYFDVIGNPRWRTVAVIMCEIILYIVRFKDNIRFYMYFHLNLKHSSCGKFVGGNKRASYWRRWEL